MIPDYSEWSKDELKDECARRELATTGTVARLVARLEEDDRPEGEAAPAAQPGASGGLLADRSANVPEVEDERGTDGFVSTTDELLMANPTVGDQQRADLDRAPRPMTVNALDGDNYTAAKQGGDTPVDGRFHKVFVVQDRRTFETAIDDDEDMHRANYVATLQEALNQGHHPRGEATYDGAEPTSDGSVRLSYSVEVIPAREDDDPADVYTPRKSLIDMGGSTIEHAQVDPEQAKLAEARTQNDPEVMALDLATSSTTATHTK